MLTPAAEDAEVLFHLLVKALSLTVGLRVTSGREIFSYTKEGVESFGEGRNELGATVGDDSGGKTEILPNVVAEFPCGHF